MKRSSIALACLLGLLVMSSPVSAADDLIKRDQEEADAASRNFFRHLNSVADGASIRVTFEKALAGDASSVPALLALLDHSSEVVAHWAARMLGHFGSASISETLKARFSTDSRPDVRCGALAGLYRMGDPATDTLAIAALADPEKGVQVVGEGVLEALGDSRNSLALLANLDSPARLRRPYLSFEALGKLGDPPGSTAVRDRLALEANNKASQWEARLAAARGLEAMGQGDLARRILDRFKASRTFSALRVIRYLIKKLAQSKGTTVQSQAALDALLFEIVTDPPHSKQDAWGRPTRAKFVSPGVFHAVSDGPDGQAGTEDDISTGEDYEAYDRRVFGDVFAP